MFTIETDNIDLGETMISNIFIDVYMPMTNALYSTIYILGYRYACDTSNSKKYNNHTIAKTLNIPLSDVVAAWNFWEEKNLINKQLNNPEDEFDFSIEFVNIKKLYTSNINQNESITSQVDTIVALGENPKIKQMFININKTICRPLVPNEKVAIMDMMDKYNMSADMVECAYNYVQDKENASKNVNYIEGILRNWSDDNIYTPEDVKNSFSEKSKRFMMIKTIFNELGFSRKPTRQEKELIDKWFDDYNFDIEMILQACSKSSNVPNPSISYINGIMKSWNEKNIRTLEDLKINEEEFKKNSNAKKSTSNSGYTNNYQQKSHTIKTKFHNANQTISKDEANELEKMLQNNS